MFKLYSQLPRSKEELQKHIEALAAMTKDREHEELFHHLYNCLSILDGKSASLLSFNSIVMAVFAIFIALEPRGFGWIAVNFGMVMILVSCLLLLSVVWVHWSTTADLKHRERHPFTLLDVRLSRTIRYRLAWYFSVSGMVGLASFLLVRIVDHLLHSPH